MPTAVPALPEDLEGLRALVLTQQREIGEKSQRLDALTQQLRFYAEYVRLLKHQRFGRSSEQQQASDDAGQAQLALAFNEAEASARESADEAGDEADAPEGVAVAARVRTPRGRRPLPAWIPRVEIVHDLAASEKVCGRDGAALARIGEEVLEQLELIPATLRVLRHVRPKYACPRCHQGVHAAPLPPQPIPKSLASPALLAHVAVSKYADGLPLYRQERMLVRAGIELPRATLAGWMLKAGELVQPLINLLREDLLATGFVQCDETPFQVLKETGKPATSQSYLWVQRGPPERPIVLYDYDPSRSESAEGGLKLSAQKQLAEAYRRAGDPRRARDAWGHYIELVDRLGFPHFKLAEGYVGLGRLYADEGRSDEAIAEYRKALAVEPRSCQEYRLAANELVKLLGRIGKSEEAVAVRSETESICPRG